jgi:hypothetical protein
LTVLNRKDWPLVCSKRMAFNISELKSRISRESQNG